MMLMHSLQQRLKGSGETPPARQNRRMPLIEAAMVAFKDVLHLGDAEARKVRRWMIRALIDAAKKPRGE